VERPPGDQFFCGCGLTGPGSLTHALVDPKSWQRHPPKQGWVALQVPRQMGSMPAFFCNCTAEAPAPRTAAIITAMNVFFIDFLPMIHLPFL
jgi:hypothetical protein